MYLVGGEYSVGGVYGAARAIAASLGLDIDTATEWLKIYPRETGRLTLIVLALHVILEDELASKVQGNTDTTAYGWL